MRRWLVLVALAGCGDDGAITPDAPIVDPDIPDSRVDDAVVDAEPDAPPDAPSDGLAIATMMPDLGMATVAAAGATTLFTVTNNGPIATGPLIIIGGGADPVDFQRTSANNCRGASLEPEATCGFAVQFAPKSAGMKEARFEVFGSPGGTASASITGIATARARVATTFQHRDFGTVDVASTSETIDIEFRNLGGEPTPALTSGITGGPGFLASGTCAGQILLPAQSCIETVRFAPQTPGESTARLVVGDHGVLLTGRGVTAGGLAVTPAAFTFTPTMAGTSATPTMVTVTNHAASSIGPLTTTATGVTSELAVVNDQCAGMSLGAGASCTFGVTFAPTGRPAATTIAITAGTTRVTTTIAGVGLYAPALAFAPPARDFGQVVIGAATSALPILLTNTGDAGTGVPALAISGPDAAQFAISDQECAVVLAPRALCTLHVKFTPTGTGPVSATLTATASPGGSSTVTLTGTGIATGGLELSPTVIEFAPNYVNEPGNINLGFARTVRLRNNGTTSTGPIAVAMGGPAPTDFMAYSAPPYGTCTELAPGEACEILITFEPKRTGRRSASLRVRTMTGLEIDAGLGGTPLAHYEVVALDDRAPTPTIDFGGAPVGTLIPIDRYVTVRDNNVAVGFPQNVHGSAMFGDPPDWMLAEDSCAGVAGVAGGLCTFKLRFAPQTAGTRAGTVSFDNGIDGNLPGNRTTQPLSGVGN